MSYRRAFSTLGCPGLMLDEVFALASRHALDAVELRALGGTTDLPTHFATHFKSPEALQEKLRTSPVQIIALDTSFKLIGHTAAERDAFLQFIPWADALGVSRLRVFDGGNAGDTAGVAEAADTMNWWRGLRAENRWRTNLMVETHDLLTTTDAVRRFAAAVPDAAILWDSHHTWKKGGEDPLVTWRALRAHIVHIHVKDSVSLASTNHPFTCVLPGTGEFPAAPLVSVLHTEFAGTLSLEWEKMWHPYLPPLEEALSAAARNRWW